MKNLLILFSLFFLACSPVNSHIESSIEPLPTSDFHSVILDYRKTAPPISTPVPPDKAPIRVIIKPTPKPTVKPHHVTTLQGGSSSAILGVASWYCLSGVSRCTNTHSSGLYAAIRKDLLYLRGKTIKVCVATNRSRCVNVTVIDCNCGPNANLIDLYADAFRKLSPLSAGRIKVSIYK